MVLACRMKNKIRYISLFLLTIFIAACYEEERPSYDVVENLLPKGGPTIKYSPENSLENVEELRSFLNKESVKIFDDSLSWYGTESSYGLDRIHGKTAKQIVNTVNCLKSTTKDQRSTCLK